MADTEGWRPVPGEWVQTPDGNGHVKQVADVAGVVCALVDVEGDDLPPRTWAVARLQPARPSSAW